MLSKIKDFYSKLTNQDKKLIAKIVFYAVIAIVLVVSGIHYLYRDKTKELQQEQIDYAKEKITELKEIWMKADNKEKEAKKEKEDSNKEQQRMQECIKENSKTGVLVICKEYNLIPTAKAYSGNLNDVTVTNYKIPWQVNGMGQSKDKSELHGNKFEEISKAHGIDIEYWYNAEKQYKVKKEVALCIAWADSGLGKYLKTKNNIGNVGNNDRGDKVHYKDMKSGVEAIFKVLNNRYLKHKQTIGSLSVGGGGSKPYYATSQENWNINVKNCLGVIHGVAINENFLIRL